MKHLNVMKYSIFILLFFLLISPLHVAAMDTAELYSKTNFDEISPSKLIFDDERGNVLSNTILDIGSYKTNSIGQLTITMWIKPLEYKYNNRIFTENIITPNISEKEGRHFTLNDGETWVFSKRNKEATIKNAPIFFNKWNFVTVVFDDINAHTNLIINDTVYSFTYPTHDSTVSNDSMSHLLLNAVGIAIDDIHIYNSVLPLDRLETLRGDKITVNSKKYEIIDKSSYVNSIDKSYNDRINSIEAQLTNPNLFYQIVTPKCYVESSPTSHSEYAAELKSKDIFSISAVNKESMRIQIKVNDSPIGWIDIASFSSNAMPLNSSFFDKTIFRISNFYNMDAKYQLIAAFICICFLFVCLRLSSRLYVYVSTKKYKTPLFIFLFPVTTLIITYVINLCFSSSETSWFFSKGWLMFPAGYTNFCHWSMFIGLFLSIVVFFAMVSRFFFRKKIWLGIIFSIIMFISNTAFFAALVVTLSYILRKNDILGIFAIIALLIILITIIIKSFQYFANCTIENNNFDNSTNSQERYEYEQFSQGGNENSDSGADTEYPFEEESNFFKGVSTIEELKKRYKDLMKIYHPDNQAGDTSVSQKLQEEYEKLLKIYE